jgi:hypothetical protein
VPPPNYREVPPNYAYREAPADYVYPEPPPPAYRYYEGPPVVRVVPPAIYPYYPYRRHYSYRLHGPRLARDPYIVPRGYRNW